MMPRRVRTRLFASALVVLIFMAACTGRPAVPRTGHPGRAPITVASFGFTESEILAELYAQALRAKAYPVRLLLDAGTRELLEPALAEGLVDLIPEYSGSAVSFLTLGARHPTPDVATTHQALVEAAASQGAVALASAAAQDANAIVVTRATAERYGLVAVSDLTAAASRLVFGGPPECPQRPLCLLGLNRVYGLSFKRFVPLDPGGPLTLQALRSGGIDVAVLFTTDPAIPTNDLVVLADDGALQPAESVTPLMRRAVITKYGAGVIEAVDAVSSRLTTAELQGLIGRVSLDGRPPHLVAAEWLQAQGLA
jgi:osmoprotectant transport system substrate-binding protein